MKKIRCTFRKTSTQKNGKYRIRFGVAVGYWPCLKAPFFQVSVWKHYLEIWYGYGSYKK